MELLNDVLEIFDIRYTICVILISYLIIQSFKKIIPIKYKTSLKRLISIIAGVILAFLFKIQYQMEMLELLPSFLLSIIAYDYLIKRLLDKVKGL